MDYGDCHCSQCIFYFCINSLRIVSYDSLRRSWSSRKAPNGFRSIASRKNFLRIIVTITTKTMTKRLLINFLMSCRDLFIFLAGVPVLYHPLSSLLRVARGRNLESDPPTVCSTNHVLSFQILRILLNENQNEIKLFRVSKSETRSVDSPPLLFFFSKFQRAEILAKLHSWENLLRGLTLEDSLEVTLFEARTFSCQLPFARYGDRGSQRLGSRTLSRT